MRTINDSCSVVYIGKKITKDHSAIIARSDDSTPLAMIHNPIIFKRNALKNKTIHGINHFSYKMPNLTYRYISTPYNQCVNKGYHWEMSAINENGVGVSATLTCHTNPKARKADPFIKNGLSEDNIVQIMGALATNARHAVEIIAKIIDKYGINEASAIWAIDQNEVWYMEIYSGHQYLALKLPEDKVFTAGNEFIFSTIDGFKKEDYFTSKNLFSLPKKKGFALYSGPHDDKHMHLTNTYGGYLIKDNYVNDNRHRRTWIGYKIFAPHSSEAKIYLSTKRYDTFIAPERNNYTIHDAIRVLRNRFEEVIDDPNFKEFKRDLQLHRLRLIGADSGHQVHAIRVFNNLPKEVACQEWFTLSSSKYSPFLPLSNGVNSFSNSYSYSPTIYDYDPNVASLVFKQLNFLCNINWKCYGENITSLWKDYELIWELEYKQIINRIKKLPIDKMKEIITRYCNFIQEEAIEIARYTFNDLLLHIMNNENSYRPVRKIEIFYPFVNLKKYLKHFNWTYHVNKKNIVTIKKGNNTCIIRPAKCVLKAKGKLTYQNKNISITTKIRNNEIFINKKDIDKIIKVTDIAKV